MKTEIFCVKTKPVYPYGLIGNCQSAALVSDCGSVDWLCLPRPDSPPVFGKLLDPDGGHFCIEPAEGVAHARQSYLPNTNVLVTHVSANDGCEYRITDFFPRYRLQNRVLKPQVMHRIVEPVKGAAHLRIVCLPVQGWSKTPATVERGDGFLRYGLGDDSLRLTSTVPMTYLEAGLPFRLTEPVYLTLNWNETRPTQLPADALDDQGRTVEYWNTWVKHCSIPTLYQTATIRSALALKLHCYEDTGAILAALTTSLPEEPGHERNWDYRFCWLRDAYFCLSAFRNLGHFEEMEGFLKFLLDIAQAHDYEKLGPVYRLDRTVPLPEVSHLNWAGFAGSLPVRSGNQAAEHIQNDVYGEMILTLAPIFFDDRFAAMRTPDHERLLEKLSLLCFSNLSQPDAGLWEVRNGWQEHSFSNLMCWAGIERTLRVQQRGYLPSLPLNLKAALDQAEKTLSKATLNGALMNGPTDATLDASLLLLPVLNFSDTELCERTVDRIWSDLRYESGGVSYPSFLYRYLRNDDFGKPKAPFLICSFWLVQALAKVGRMDEAKQVMEGILTSSNELGLFAEHFLPSTGAQSGNFPQAYSHVGLINAAFAISPHWHQIL